MGEIQLCKALNLIGAVFELGTDRLNALKQHYSIPVPSRNCQCGAKLDVRNQTGFCRTCYCKSLYIDVSCDWCGNLFKRRAKELVYFISKQGYQHCFCNRQCLGRWVAFHFGFTAHPENRRIEGGKRKWDWDMIWQKHLETGYGCNQLSRLLGIPVPTISRILRNRRETHYAPAKSN